MIITNLSLTNYRGYKKCDVSFGKNVNFFIGNNGSGKTNLLEAIYYLALAKSYKTADSSTIKSETEFARITAKIKSDKEFIPKIIISKIGKKISINNQEIDKLSDYIGKVKILAFLPEDMDLIKGAPKNRRYFIDMIIGQIDKNYLVELGNYKNILKQRNELLKILAESKSKDYTLLDIYTEQLARSAEIIIAVRKSFIDKVQIELEQMYHYLAANNKKISFIYRPVIENEILSQLRQKYQKDLFMMTTNLGPHRDDYDFFIDEVNARDFASQGEQRVIILAIILSIANIVIKEKNIKPILLLDDVFSELDYLRQNQLVKYLNSTDIQSIITTTNIKDINTSFLNNSKTFNVKNHLIKEGKN
ncbi:MAG: DNA replication/repair protein RecF [Candidatus Izemoplasmatales bacterium]|nr:DNA replication/repair protein RecF [Candidatus Izemoplasmatales bacterium]